MTPELTKFIRRQDLYKAVFWWIKSKQDSFPTASIEQCLKTFYDKFKIEPEKFPVETARKVFQRMNEEFMIEEEKMKEQFAHGKKE